MEQIIVRGARTHNLKNITVSIPRDRLCVVTGLSGSGKSSLAFDTLYAEGQRRYVESLSSYARQFLQLMDKPDVDSIEGLSPAISIEQKSTSHNPRSTVGTITEIHDYLRLLYARIGIAKCPTHGTPLRAQTVSEMVDQTLAYPEGTKLMILAPVVRGRKGEYKQLFADLAQQGYIRARIDGEIYELSDPPELKLHIKHNIEVIIDRVRVKPDIKQRLADSFETTLKVASGLAMIVPMDEHAPEDEVTLSSRYACPYCDYSIPELEPRDFSFNNPHGACPRCDGLGHLIVFSPDKIIPDPRKSLEGNAITLWDKSSWAYYVQLKPACKALDIPMDVPFAELSEEQQHLILYGNEDDPKLHAIHAFSGVIPYFEHQVKETESESYQEQLQELTENQICPECHGQRLKPEYCHVFVGDKSLPAVNDLSINEAYEFFTHLQLSEQDMTIASRILKEVRERLMFLKDVGLGYLTLARAANTLSGGESQRIRLASQIGSSLVGVMYILDEPSIGLHQRDNQRLLDALKHLRDLGNSVIVVEHDEDAIRQADYIVDIGPKAGVHGGQVIACGTPAEIMACPNSITADYLSGRKSIAVPKIRHYPQGYISLKGCHGNNLQHIDVDFPRGCLVVVTGISGSGKSTLVNDTLVPLISQYFNHAERFVSDQLNDRGKMIPAASADSNSNPKLLAFLEKSFACSGYNGLEAFDKIICIDQSPIGRTPRSNPATYTDLFTPIRELFASTPDARARGYKAGRFSFNIKGGRCEACHGDGTIRVEMHFLPNVYVQCEQCQGQRYNRETLEVKYKGKNISDVLNMTVEEAYEFFDAVPRIRNKLQALMDVGLSYITLGQSALTFSGGEAQRIKLAKELSRVSTGNTLYVLDEPTTGLHFHDVKQLLDMLMRLRDEGNTVIVIEHNLDVIKCADYLIDLGPEGGNGGGRIVATGTPEEVALKPQSFTGQFLKPILQKAGTLTAAAKATKATKATKTTQADKADKAAKTSAAPAPQDTTITDTTDNSTTTTTSKTRTPRRTRKTAATTTSETATTAAAAAYTKAKTKAKTEFADSDLSPQAQSAAAALGLTKARQRTRASSKSRS